MGLADGDMVKVKATGGRIIITPQLVIDRSQFPNADDEYTPAQERRRDDCFDESRSEEESSR